KQKAHEVTRDVTAWALLWPRTDFVRQPAPCLGPPRSAQPDPYLSTGFRQTVDRELFAVAIAHPTGWRSGFPTGRLWVSLRDRPLGRSLPDPVPRIELLLRVRYRSLGCGSGSGAPFVGGLSPRGAVRRVR